MYKNYGLNNREWNIIKDKVVKNRLTSIQIKKEFNLSSKQIWFLFDKLLQEKYNHLYKRDKLVDPKAGDFVYCCSDGFGRGTIDKLLNDGLMLVKFNKRELPTLCSSESMTTLHDEVKRKVTKL